MAAIVAVVAVCAVSFMISQRPQEAIAVAEGDPLTGEVLRGPQTAPPAPAPLRPIRRPAAPALAQATPGAALSAEDAASDASAVEPAR